MNVSDARSSSVLLVEGSDADSACIARALTFQGEPHPFVAQIVSRNDALRRLARSTFDVALVDLSPFEEAITTLRDIRRAAPDMPIVALTCHVDEHQALEVLKLGVQDHLFKTEVSAKLLVRSLRFAVERNRADTLESLNRKLVAAERSLQEAKEQLETKNRRLAELYRTAHEFVDNVSHEFRTPLTVIKEYVSLIEDGVVGDISGEQRRMLAIVEDRADDLNTMVDDMLD
ncbi:MAG: response regulator, partial [Planctomycetales bacterium]|nr:response regulator [Planctomycetales bacterium]